MSPAAHVVLAVAATLATGGGLGLVGRWVTGGFRLLIMPDLPLLSAVVLAFVLTLVYGR